MGLQGCMADCASVHIGPSTQCVLSGNCPNDYIYFQDTPGSLSWDYKLHDYNGSVITPYNIIPNTTGLSTASFWSIAKTGPWVFVVVRYWNPGSNQSAGQIHKLVKLRTGTQVSSGNCAASVEQVWDNGPDTRAMAAVNVNRLIVAFGKSVFSVRTDLAQLSYVYLFKITYGLSSYGVITQNPPTAGYGVKIPNNPDTQTNPYWSSSMWDVIEDLVYLPGGTWDDLDGNYVDIGLVAVLINNSSGSAWSVPYDGHVLTYKIRDWHNHSFSVYSTWWSGAYRSNPQVGISNTVPGGEGGHMSLYSYNGNLITHNSYDGARAEYTIDEYGNPIFVQSPPPGLGSGLNVGYGDAGSSPGCGNVGAFNRTCEFSDVKIASRDLTWAASVTDIIVGTMGGSHSTVSAWAQDMWDNFSGFTGGIHGCGFWHDRRNNWTIELSTLALPNEILLKQAEIDFATEMISLCSCDAWDGGGCTDPTAQNYNPAATVDDGSCIATVYGCTDPAAINYYAGAQVDDGSCCYVWPCNPVVPGCTDSTATNYNPSATVDDGSCTYPPPVNPCKELWTINPTLVQSCCEWCEENALIPGGLYGPPPTGCFDWHCDCCKPPMIKNLDLDLSDIPAAGERRAFTITGEGDGEVEFELRVRDKDTGKYYNFVTNLFQTEETSLEDKIK